MRRFQTQVRHMQWVPQTGSQRVRRNDAVKIAERFRSFVSHSTCRGTLQQVITAADVHIDILGDEVLLSAGPSLVLLCVPVQGPGGCWPISRVPESLTAQDLVCEVGMEI